MQVMRDCLKGGSQSMQEDDNDRKNSRECWRDGLSMSDVSACCELRSTTGILLTEYWGDVGEYWPVGDLFEQNKCQ